MKASGDMVTSRWIAAAWMEVGLILLTPGCGGGGRGTNVTTAPTTYLLTVNSATPASGVPISVAPADNNGASNGTTSFTRTYNAGATVTLTAPATAGPNAFTSWSGCATASTTTCTVTLNANTSVTAAYAAPLTHVLTVTSTNPSSGVAITASPADNSNVTAGSTSLTLTYNTGTTVTLTASSTSGSNGFASWTGCTIPTNTLGCQVTLNRDLTVTANYGGTVTGKVYYVSGAGNDSADGLSTTTPLLTLQHAANLTQPGDTVYAMNGTFTNSNPSGDVLDISTPGTQSNWITYKAYPGQTPMLSFNGWEGVFLEPSAAYIEVNGFTIVGNNGNVTLAGAQAQSTTNPDPAYNGNCIAADGRQGTATQRPHHLKILNNVISECGGGGIGTLQADYLTISGNTIYNTSWYAIYGTSGISTLGDWNSDSSTATKVFITGNRLYGNQEFIPWVNAGVITDGRLLSGARGQAGEIGHVRLSATGPVGYNKAGSVEGWVSGGGMAQVARREVEVAIGNGAPTALAETLRSSGVLTAKDVALAAQNGDALAQRIVHDTGSRLGEALAILVDLFNPERIVIGGLAMRFGESLLAPARIAMKREALPASAEICEIVPAALGEQIGDVAAISIAMGH